MDCEHADKLTVGEVASCSHLGDAPTNFTITLSSIHD